MITMRRGGWSEGGAETGDGVEEATLGRYMVLCSCDPSVSFLASALPIS